MRRKPLGKSLLYSFLAMGVGWVVCNVTFWLGNIRSFLDPHQPIGLKLHGMLWLAGYTGLVVLLAWIVIFFPAFYFIRTSSRWWRPFPASLMGALFGYLTIYVFFLVHAIHKHVFDIRAWLRIFVAHDLWPLYIGAVATGLTAALFATVIKSRVREKRGRAHVVREIMS